MAHNKELKPGTRNSALSTSSAREGSTGKPLPPGGTTSTTGEFPWLQDVSSLLRRGDLVAAITLLNSEGADWLTTAIYIGSHRMLPATEVEAAYSALLEKLARRFAAPTFNKTRPLKPYLWKAAITTGKDLRRTRARQWLQSGEEEVLLQQPAPLDTKANGRRLEGQEFLAYLWDLIGNLPFKQKLVVSVYIDNFEDFQDENDFVRLAALVSANTGKPENHEAVRKSWEAALAKIQPALCRKGWGCNLRPVENDHEEKEGGKPM